MELLQKLTLYDLLGYALPGTVLLCIGWWDDINTKLLIQHGTVGWCWIVLIFLGYTVGIIISEMATWIFHLFHLDTSMEDVCDKCGISGERITKALKCAGMIEGEESVNYETAAEYMVQIYADIQTDSNYMRIHNYASAALVYKNLAVVFMFCLLFKWCELNWQMIVIVLGVIALLVVRWVRFDNKKMCYTLSWFVKKYDTK